MNPPVRSSAAIGSGCPLNYRVTCDAQINISLGGVGGILELRFQPEALREFLELAGEALDEVDARFIAIRAQAV